MGVLSFKASREGSRRGRSWERGDKVSGGEKENIEKVGEIGEVRYERGRFNQPN